jgi:hypothetical protein
MTELKAIIRVRSGTSSSFSSTNQIYANGEITFATDRGKFKIGNGRDSWNNLPYIYKDRILTVNDNNSSSGITDDGNNLSLPLPVTTEWPVSSSTQVSAGTHTLRALTKRILDNLSWIFANKADLAGPVFTMEITIPAKTAAVSADNSTKAASEAQVFNSIAQAVSGTQKWLEAVETKAGLPAPSSLDRGVNWLCRVIKDPSPSNIGVWQLIAGSSPAWTYFSDNIDFVDERELAAAISAAIEADAAAWAQAIEDEADRTDGLVEADASAWAAAIEDEADRADKAISDAVSDEAQRINEDLADEVSTLDSAKLDKIKGETFYDYVYSKFSNGTQSYHTLSTAAASDSIPRRDEKGELYASPGSSDPALVTKGQMETHVNAAVNMSLQDHEGQAELPPADVSWTFRDIMQTFRDNLKWLKLNGGGEREDDPAMEYALPPLLSDRDGNLIAARGGILIELHVNDGE